MGKARIRLTMAMVAIPAAAGIALAVPAMALADADDGGVGQHEHAGQVSGTSQDADATTVAPQENDASNLSVLSDGSGGVFQSDPNNATSAAGNSSDTDQAQSQRERAWLHQFME